MRLRSTGTPPSHAAKAPRYVPSPSPQRGSAAASRTAPTSPTPPAASSYLRDGFEDGTRPSVLAPGQVGDRQSLARRLDAYLKEHAYYWKGANGKGEVTEKAPVGERARADIARALLKYPPNVVEELMRSKVDFKFVDPANPPVDFDPRKSREWPGVEFTGAYGATSTGAAGDVVLNQRMLDPKYAAKYGSLEATVLHETAHFWDDLRHPNSGKLKKGEHTDASASDPAFVAMFEAYRERFRAAKAELGLKGFDPQPQRDALERYTDAQTEQLGRVLFDGGYSMTGVGEFLSMGVEFYLGSASQRAALEKIAPELYRYIQDDFLA